MAGKRTTSKRSAVKQSAADRRMVLSTSVVADNNRESVLARKRGSLSSNRSRSRPGFRHGQCRSGGTSDDDYTDGDEEGSDDETDEESDDETTGDPSSSGAVVLTGAARRSSGSCGCPTKRRRRRRRRRSRRKSGCVKKRRRRRCRVMGSGESNVGEVTDDSAAADSGTDSDMRRARSRSTRRDGRKLSRSTSGPSPV